MGKRDSQIGPVSLDQLLALNDEIASLVRAGIPLERGLTELGREAPGKMGVLASRLSERLRNGENLEEIVAKEEALFPPVWRAVVLAGLRSGHLATALESLSLTSRRALEMRRAIAFALVYPTIVLGLAFGLLVFSMLVLVPAVARASQELIGSLDAVQLSVQQMARWVHVWGVAIPLLAVCLVAGWWIRSGWAIRTSRGNGGQRRFLFRRYSRRPSVKRTLLDGRMATFAEVLRMLDQHEVPLPEAIVLAADASGDRALSKAAREIARRIENGEKLERREDLPRAFPPLLAWSVVAGLGRAGLQSALSTSAEMYRRRALDAARWATVYLPMLLTVVLGGSVVLFQAMIVFIPLYDLLHGLAIP